jgi:hypothetical protein
LLVDHGLIAQQLVQFLFRRQEEMIGEPDKLSLPAVDIPVSGASDSRRLPCEILKKGSLLLSRRNLKSRDSECSSTSGFPSSRFAPATKSAQIISRQ